MFRVFIFLIMLGLLALSIVLSMLNPAEIEIDLYFHIYIAPLPLFFFTRFLIGSFVALLFFFSAFFQNKHQYRTKATERRVGKEG